MFNRLTSVFQRYSAIVIVCFLIIIVTVACDPFSGSRPTNYPNDRWVSEDPDMYFEVGPNDSGRVKYAQIVFVREDIESEE